ncbi:MAG: hypothetical protein HN559_23535, partial [Gemmatimonadetes bacterium]|nr:hypothetical protein [Gemmatimonadota bacterium]
MATVISAGTAFDTTETARIITALKQDGYAHLGAVLEQDEVEALRDAVVRKSQDPRILADHEGDHIRGISLMRMFEYDNAFRDLIVRDPFVSLAEAVLGDDCHVMAQNALIYGEGQGGGWHVDDALQFPLPAETKSHDAACGPPCLVMQIFTPLTDMDTNAGCTQVVPGSHLSGRRPDAGDAPSFMGQEPISLDAKAGEAYVFNNQIWHQGAKNQSTSPRILGGVTYSRRFVAQRFYPFVDYQ